MLSQGFPSVAVEQVQQQTAPRRRLLVHAGIAVELAAPASAVNNVVQHADEALVAEVAPIMADAASIAVMGRLFMPPSIAGSPPASECARC